MKASSANILDQYLDDLSSLAILASVLLLVKQSLTAFAKAPNFIQKMRLAFGAELSEATVLLLQSQWEVGDFSVIPALEIQPASYINSALGAFSAATNTIYLSQELLTEYQHYPERIAAVWLEEFGHFVDARINSKDAVGDEGASFSALVQGQSLSVDDLEALRTEDDTALVILNDQQLLIEQSQISDNGGFEGSRKVLQLDSNGGGKAIVDYEFYTIPDRILLRYEGKNILDTDFISGSDTIEVNIPTGSSNQLEVLLLTNDEDTLWNYTVESENKSYIVFRESDSGIPGWDHVGLYFNGLVYEAHPGYPSTTYFDQTEKRNVVISDQVKGVQAQHTLNSFIYDQGKTKDSALVEIPTSLAQKMVDQIKPKLGSASYTFENGNIQAIYLPNQKGRNNQFTCVGLIEWAAEQAGLNGGQGFIPTLYERFYLAGSTKIGAIFGGTGFLLPLELKFFSTQSTNNWIQGSLDPVDFIVTDPLGRRLGYTANLGTINEIPGAIYTGNGDLEQFSILEPLPGTYTVQLFGVGEQVTGAIQTSSSSTVVEVSEVLSQGQTKTLTASVPQRSGATGIVDLSIIRTDSSAFSSLGEQFIYTLNITNSGSNTATNVVLKETLPSGVKYISASTTASVPSSAFRFSDGLLTGSLGSIAAGRTVAVNVTATALAAGDLTGSSIVTSREADLDITNNLISGQRRVLSLSPAAADLELTQSIDTKTATLGGQVNITLNLTNKGPGVATGVQVTDLLPAGLSFVSANTIQGKYDSKTGIWDAGNLKSNLSRTLKITAKVNTTGLITNTAEITSVTEADSDSVPRNSLAAEDDITSLAFRSIFGIMGTAPSPINFRKGKAGVRQQGQKGNDNLRGTRRRDRLNGKAGDDQISGLAGNDQINGASGKDRVKGGAGDDLLLGGKGEDRLVGNTGNDVIVGGAGNDVLMGSAGSDLFVFNALTEGNDSILDFNSTTDLIDLRSIFSTSAFSLPGVSDLSNLLCQGQISLGILPSNSIANRFNAGFQSRIGIVHFLDRLLMAR